LVLVHGDFWPGNTIWRGDRLAAVIDWEDAGLGYPLIDVANVRLEILRAHSREAMERFTEAHAAVQALEERSLPLFDLVPALRLTTFPTWGLAARQMEEMHQRWTWFIGHALNRLGIPD
jgi:aminoglycoside phosphotransferase (APT) family kinase protein